MPRMGHGTAVSLDDMRAAAARVAERSAKVPFAFAVVTPADPSRFDYLFPQLQNDPDALLPVSAQTVVHLKNLGRAMRDPTPDDAKNSTIPAAYTYFGQFIDHDITLETVSATLPELQDPGLQPMTLEQVKATLFNTRTATLDLDSLYGVPAPRLGPRMKTGTVAPTTGRFRRPPGKTAENDLPRDERSPDPRFDRSALIGDPRNDENTIVAQLHLSFLLAHNALVDRGMSFEDARRTLRQHYQWMVLHDFLKQVCDPTIVDAVVQNGPRFYRALEEPFFLPIEFSVAAYRFGHSMVRASYNFNVNFAIPGDLPASLGLLFTFTALSGQLGNFDTLPEHWIIEWERFFPAGVNLARRLNTHLVEPLFRLTNSVGQAETAGGEDAPRLAVRNLLRGYLLRMPTGQAVARTLGIRPMTSAEIETAADSAAQVEILRESGFNERTPLWYYILAEANTLESKGNRLGPVGSTLLAEVFVGLVQRSEDSILRSAHPWQPTLGSKGRFALPDLLRFAGRLQ